MRRLSFIAGTLILTALAGFVMACDDPVSRMPNTPSAPAISTILITGPDTIAPAQTAQFTAMVRLSDGTTKAPSAGTVLWTNGGGGLQVSQSGVVIAPDRPGEAFLVASIGTGNARRQVTKALVIIPDGTYRMVGMVSEAGFPTVPVIGARVEASPGGAFAITDLDGRYRLYGVPPNAVITITKDDYAPSSQNVQLIAHETRNFQLTFIGSRPVIGGSFTLTLDATGNCSSSRPPATSLQRRTYDAFVTQNGPEITVTLTEARFRTNTIARGNRFTGRITGGGATFFLGYFDAYYYPYYGPAYYPNIAERLPDSSILVPYGNAITSGASGGLSGTMNGGLQVFDSRFPAFNTNTLSFCSSSAMLFSLMPR